MRHCCLAGHSLLQAWDEVSKDGPHSALTLLTSCQLAMQVPNFQEKDPELAKAAENILQDVSEGRGAPPGFEPAVTTSAPMDTSTVQPDAEMGVRLAELALAEPTPAPTLAAVQAGADPALPSGQVGGQQMTAPGLLLSV